MVKTQLLGLIRKNPDFGLDPKKVKETRKRETGSQEERNRM